MGAGMFGGGGGMEVGAGELFYRRIASQTSRCPPS
jgi:hypothetical protein